MEISKDRKWTYGDTWSYYRTFTSVSKAVYRRVISLTRDASLLTATTYQSRPGDLFHLITAQRLSSSTRWRLCAFTHAEGELWRWHQVSSSDLSDRSFSTLENDVESHCRYLDILLFAVAPRLSVFIKKGQQGDDSILIVTTGSCTCCSGHQIQVLKVHLVHFCSIKHAGRVD